MGYTELLAQLETLGAVACGCGPKHPVSPQPSLQEEIDQFFSKYPQLRHDQSYREFLETYAGTVVERPDETLSIHIYGFTEDITMYLSTPDESVLEEDATFFRFADITLNLEQKRGLDIGIGFAFDISGTRRAGVYRSTYFPDKDFQASYYPPGVAFLTSKNNWYCDSFIEWLERVTRFKGVLLT